MFEQVNGLPLLPVKGCWGCHVFGYTAEERIGADLHAEVARSRILFSQPVSESGCNRCARELNGSFFAQNGLDGR